MLLPQSNDDLADGNIRLTIVMHRLAWGGGRKRGDTPRLFSTLTEKGSNDIKITTMIRI